MPGGRPWKKNKNTLGLKQNQTLQSISTFDEGLHVDKSWEPSPDDGNLKDIFNSETESVLDCEIDEDCRTDEEEWSDDEEFSQCLTEMAYKLEVDDSKDDDWCYDFVEL